jgi:NADH-quinone oxidoreductase subunit N
LVGLAIASSSCSRRSGIRRAPSSDGRGRPLRGFFKLFTVAALDRRRRVRDERPPRAQAGIGEYYFLLLGAAIGIFFMVGTNNLLLADARPGALCARELLARRLPQGQPQVGRGLDEVRDLRRHRAPGVMLYGISLLYGSPARSTSRRWPRGLGRLVLEPRGSSHASPIPSRSRVVLVLAGFAYKVSGRPVPLLDARRLRGRADAGHDVPRRRLQGGGLRRAAAFLGALFVKSGRERPSAQYGAASASSSRSRAATMTLGNLAALRQQSLKRMLAYSSIAHAGLRAGRRRGDDAAGSARRCTTSPRIT